MSDAAERLRRRYPQPVLRRPVIVAGTAVVAAVFGAWLVWSAWFHAHPPVTAQVSAYTVASDSKVALTLTVDRPDPSKAATCRVVAQAVDFSTVAEQTVAVAPSIHRVVDLPLTLVTVRRATSASVRECSV